MCTLAAILPAARQGPGASQRRRGLRKGSDRQSRGADGRGGEPALLRPPDSRSPVPNPALRYPSPMRKDPIEQLLRALYSAALYLLVPVTVYHLIWRGFRQPEYFQRWNERYAAYGAQSHAETVWIHAVPGGGVEIGRAH